MEPRWMLLASYPYSWSLIAGSSRWEMWRIHKIGVRSVCVRCQWSHWQRTRCEYTLSLYAVSVCAGCCVYIMPCLCTQASAGEKCDTCPKSVYALFVYAVLCLCTLYRLQPVRNVTCAQSQCTPPREWRLAERFITRCASNVASARTVLSKDSFLII